MTEPPGKSGRFKIFDGNARARLTLMIGFQGGKDILVVHRNRRVSIVIFGSEDNRVSDHVVENSAVSWFHFSQNAYTGGLKVLILFGGDCDEQVRPCSSQVFIVSQGRLLPPRQPYMICEHFHVVRRDVLCLGNSLRFFENLQQTA